MQAQARASGETQGFLAAGLMAFGATVVLLGLALSPGPDTNRIALIFKPGMTADATLRATLDLGGRPISTKAAGRIVFADFEALPRLGQLWKFGALVALDPLLKTGCTSPPNQQIANRHAGPAPVVIQTKRPDMETKT